ncbi:MAG: hypothetical protein ACQEXJ_06340 [Myxococcota bacterium]
MCAAALVLAACGGGGSEDPSFTGPDGGGGTDLPSQGDAAPDTDPAQPDAGPDVGEPEQPTGWCAAGPPQLSRDLAPDLREWVLAREEAGCALQAMEVDEGLDGSVDTQEAFPSKPCGADCAEQLPGFAVAWSEESEFAGQREDHRRGVVEAWRLQDGSLEAVLVTRRESSNATERLERRWDADGRLLEERHWWDDSLWRELTQTWDGDRLVGATVVDHVNGTGAWEYAWQYGDARLLSATLAHEGETASVTWEYDDQGRPLHVERRVDDEVWLEQSWSWDEAASGLGVLAERTSSWRTGLSSNIRALDDHQPRHASPLAPAPWTGSLPREVGSCERVPTAILHGYPEAEGVWDLGWPVGERPHGIGFDYGYQGYAYNYGDDAWFGHGGVGGAGDLREPSRRGETTITYDAGERFAGAETTWLDEDGEVVGEAIRTRTLDGDRVVEDRLERTIAGGEPLVTAFAFAWDAEGRLAERSYRYEGAELARHTWAWDAQDRIIAHGIRWHGLSEGAAAALAQEWFHEGWGVDVPSDLPAAPPLVATHERVWSDDGNEVTWQRVDGPTGDVSVFRSVTTEPGPDGLVVETATGGAVTRTTFDPEGRRLSQVTEHGNGETWTWSYEPRSEPIPGGLVLAGWTLDAPRAVEEATFTYACEGS